MTEYKNVYSALAAAQGEIKNPSKDKAVDFQSQKGRVRYKYADLADCFDVIRPVLSKYGISITQPTEMVDDMITVKTVLSHGDSDTHIESIYPVCKVALPHKDMGGNLTYARRYALCAIVGIAADEDQDAEGTTDFNNEGKQTQKQKQTQQQDSSASQNGPTIPNSEADKIAQGLIKEFRQCTSSEELLSAGQSQAAVDFSNNAPESFVNFVMNAFNEKMAEFEGGENA